MEANSPEFQKSSAYPDRLFSIPIQIFIFNIQFNIRTILQKNNFPTDLPGFPDESQK